eukprot:s1162_g22.t1
MLGIGTAGILVDGQTGTDSECICQSTQDWRLRLLGQLTNEYVAGSQKAPVSFRLKVRSVFKAAGKQQTNAKMCIATTVLLASLATESIGNSVGILPSQSRISAPFARSKKWLRLGLSFDKATA